LKGHQLIAYLPSVRLMTLLVWLAYLYNLLSLGDGQRSERLD
jgi:hypothetical protein